MTDTAASDQPFGFWTATALVVGGMIAAGVFILPAQMAPYGVWSIAAWALAIAGSLLLALVFIALHRQLPGARGAIELVEIGLGPLPGMLVGWSYWLSILCANAVISLTAAGYAASFVPGLGGNRSSLLACGLIVALTLLNIAGTRIAGWFQVGATAAKVVPLLGAALLLGVIAVQGGMGSSPLPVPPLDRGMFDPLTAAMFALLGFEAASVAAARVRDPERNVARATIAGLAIAGGLYMVICTGMALAIPADVLAKSEAPFALLFDRFVGSGSATLIAAAAALAAFGALNGWILLQGEVPRAMALTGTLPAWFARSNAAGVPVNTHLLSAAIGVGLVLTQLGDGLSEVLTFMVTLTTATSLWLYLAIAVSGIRLRAAPWAAWGGLVFALLVLWGIGWGISLLSLVLMLSGLPFYRRVRTAAAS
jgi:basic amino acid/polyamine antiporter, APA family